MPVRNAVQLLVFSALIAAGRRWSVSDFQAVPPEWIQAVEFLGAFGVSGVITACLRWVWRTLMAGERTAGGTDGVPAVAVAPFGQKASDAPEDHEAAPLLRESGLVDATWYMGVHPDVAASSFDAANHYLHHGAAEGRDPNPYFDTSWYLEQNPDVREDGINPLLHYILEGAAEGRSAGPRFDTAVYKAENDDVAQSGLNPLAHYLEHGRFENRQATRSPASNQDVTR